MANPLSKKEASKVVAKRKDLNSHQKDVLRNMLMGNSVLDSWNDYWLGEEARTLNNNNRYHDDI